MRDRFYSRFLNGRDPIRALYVLPSGGFGGVERQASFVLPQLPAWGVDVLPLVGPASTLVSWLEDEGMRDVLHSQAFELPEDQAGAVKRLVSLGFAWRGARRAGEEVERLIHERSIDVVVGAGPVGWLAASEATRRLGLPLVWWAPQAPGRGESTMVRGLAAFGRPDLLLCGSQDIEAAWGGVVHAPTEVVAGAIDLNRFRRGTGRPARFRPEGATHVIGFESRLTCGRPVAELIDLAAGLRTRFPGIRFLVAGDGPERAHAEEMAAARGLAGAFTFLGFVRDMRSFYAACDLLVVPGSEQQANDGSSQGAIEAMAMQVPVVTVDLALVSELLGAPERRLALAARNHEHVRLKFDAQRTARRTARLLQTLVAWSGAGAAPVAVPARPRPRLELAT